MSLKIIPIAIVAIKYNIATRPKNRVVLDQESWATQQEIPRPNADKPPKNKSNIHAWQGALSYMACHPQPDAEQRSGCRLS